MKLTKKLLKFGDSLVVVIDKPIRDKMKLERGDLIEIDIKKVE